MMKTTRLTLDLDACYYADAFKKFYKVLHEVENIGGELLQSASGNGFHIVIYLKDAIEYKEQLKLREKYGDCEMRMKHSIRDLKRGFNPDVLFTHKKIDGEWKTEKVLIEVCS